MKKEETLKFKKLHLLWLIPMAIIMGFGAVTLTWEMVKAIPDSINSVIHPKHQESTCESLLKTMSPSDDGYEAMMEHCSNP